ncbi:MAG: MFS transporter [Lachnospiraceae bacterium]|nr:MFS transporter [Lachnospiraceae bacterium]
MKKINIDRLDILSFFNGLVFYAPVALLVRTNAGVSTAQFFVLQAVLSLIIFVFEIPTGMITDRIGYKNTMVLAQAALVLARVLLLAAYMEGSYLLFVAEAAVEGLAACFLSGTQEAYIYSVYEGSRCPVKMARVSNFGTAGFIVSTLLYAAIYQMGAIPALIAATIAASAAGIPCAAGVEREPYAAMPTENRTRGRAGMLAVFADARMILMVLLGAGFSVAFLLINFFYVDKLLACGLRAELMSLIIIAYSAVQMRAEKLLGRISGARCRTAMLAFILAAGALMAVFGMSRTPGIVVPIMVVLPLVLNVPQLILVSMENTCIDRCGQESRRATILSAANMAGNLIEMIVLFASAFIAGIGVFACFWGAGILLMVLGILNHTQNTGLADNR